MPFQLAQAITDERGQYQIGGLSAGRYIVTAAAPDEDGPFDDIPVTTQEDLDRAAGATPRARGVETPRSLVYAPMFYPDALDPARAEPLTLAAGNRHVVDFELRRVALAEIAGVIRTPDGPSTNGISATLDPIDPLFGSERTYVDVEPDGSFRVSGLLPGRYRLAVRANASEGARLKGVAAVAEITLNELDQTLTLDLLPGATISGRVVIDSREPGGDSDLMVTAHALSRPVESFGGAARVDADGSFTLVNVMPGLYRLSVLRGARGQSTVVSQTVDGRNTLDGGLEVGPGQRVTGVQVIATTAAAEISGIVRTADGGLAMDADVVLFPTDPSAWHPRSPRILATQTDRNGRYSFRNVPPGEYRIAAAPDMGTDEWRDPELLALLQPASTAVVLQAGRSATVDLSGP
jgi:hypothetical protein